MSILTTAQDISCDSEAQLADVIRAGGPFVVAGGGTSRIGLAEGDRLRWTGTQFDYDPGALTLVVSAGMSVDAVSARLAEEHQRVAFEPPDLGPLLGREGARSIGGMVASNASGPRRVAVGACRDACLGVRFVDGRGEIVKNGGRVMKNVTGLDLVKLMAGSQGTLGVLTEVSLKTQPIPETTATLIFEGQTEAEAVNTMSRALGTPFDITGAAHLRQAADGTPARTLLRLEGIEGAVRYRVEALQTRLSDLGEAAVEWEAAQSEATWGAIRDVTRFVGVPGDVWRLSVTPSTAPALVAAIAPLDVIYDWGGGRLWLLTPAGTDVRAKMGQGHASLVRASDETKRRLGVFPPENTIVARLSQGLRQTFDPEQKFNPRMMG
ncbi:FAD-binding protein [Celeribacter baekdonensis]|uniref:FAD-binding protein n=1 Tax=Celeribacter baekdonensis TaxID=875171 RepID=UPI0030D815E1|tara:strand:- start:186605 stop:187744 length:1140 start_codon:yes stop_codon:yes gene_type:complete